MNKYSKYINDHIKAYNAIDTKKILLIEKVLINKIKKKKYNFYMWKWRSSLNCKSFFM